MKLAISSQGKDINSEIDPRFGRCAYFLIVDSESMEYEAIPNSYAMAMGGAGIQTGQMIANKGVEVVITGNCGPNAFQVLTAAGIKIIIGVSGKVIDAVNKFKEGKLSSYANSPNVSMHAGVAQGAGMPLGVGLGLGMGMGRGRGIGARRRGISVSAFSQSNQQMYQQDISKEQEIQMLKLQANILKQQLEQVMVRLNEIERKNREKK